MKRRSLILLFTCCLTLPLLFSGLVEAGKGRSYSSGGSSSSRSSSFRSSAPSRSSGRSYSSGGSSAARSTPTPSFNRSSPARRSAGPSFDSAAAAAQRRQESKRSFEIRSTPQGRSYSVGSPAPTRSPAGRSYSAGRSQPSGPVKSPTGGSFDSAAAAAQRRQESKAAFTLGTKPRPTYSTSDGKAHPLDARDKRVEEIRRDIDPGRWATRDERRRTVFRNPPAVPVVIYQDPYSNWFWWWLLAQDLNTRALWAYHHQNDMDAARYRDLLAKDAQLQERIRELEAKKGPRDSTYAPLGVDRDLMYDDGFVEAAVNPQSPPPPSTSHWLARTVGKIVLVLAGMAFLVWLVFIKRWGGD